MSKKKICFIAQFPPPIHGLSKAVETLYNSKLNEIYDFEKIDITNNKNFLINLLKIFKSNADLFYFTISQTKGGNLRDLIIMKVLALQNKKCLIHLHGGYYRQLVDVVLPKWQKEANYKAIKKLDGAIVLGDSLKKIFHGMIAEKKIFTVPNCVDDEFVISDRRFKEKQEQLSERKIKHILFLSNLIRTKGYPLVLELALAEKERCEVGARKRYHFDFCGKFFDDKEKMYFYSYVKENNLEEYVSYHGVVMGDEKRKFLELADFFILPTRYPNEGQPISIIEAMANGLVVVTTDHAGIPDLVKNTENGIMLKEGEKLSIELLDAIDVNMVGSRNRNRAVCNYTEANYIQNMEKCLEEVVNQ